jgi:hypothetical protein
VLAVRGHMKKTLCSRSKAEQRNADKTVVAPQPFGHRWQQLFRWSTTSTDWRWGVRHQYLPVPARYAKNFVVGWSAIAVEASSVSVPSPPIISPPGVDIPGVSSSLLGLT